MGTGYAPETAILRHAIDHIDLARIVAGMAANGESRWIHIPDQPYTQEQAFIVIAHHLEHALVRLANFTE